MLFVVSRLQETERDYYYFNAFTLNNLTLKIYRVLGKIPIVQCIECN
jgi:hypothetical protein